MATRRLKIDKRNYKPIPKHSSQKYRQRRQYLLRFDDKMIHILAYSKSDIARKFNIKIDKISSICTELRYDSKREIHINLCNPMSEDPLAI